ncbi:MAG TPA: hypothetical protein VMO26_25030 [Vicinamibacterales bacterium]|nr:hypothetical protein [Vicinamibacterales bacterium]
MTVTGNFDGHDVVLWASMITGLETITIDGREMSRKRSFGLQTTHDLSSSGVDVDAAVVKILPLRLELRKRGAVVATFKHRLGLLLPLLAVLAGLLVGAAFYALGRLVAGLVL